VSYIVILVDCITKHPEVINTWKDVHDTESHILQWTDIHDHILSCNHKPSLLNHNVEISHSLVTIDIEDSIFLDIVYTLHQLLEEALAD